MAIVVLIGRGQECDVQIVDDSISRKHAELVMLADGRFYLTDRNSKAGTQVRLNGQWETLRQGFVASGTQVRMGNSELTIDELARRAVRAPMESMKAAMPVQALGAATNSAPAKDDGLPFGPVRRDIRTGDIISAE